MSPSKWITFKNTQAPGRVYAFHNGEYKTCTQEDFFVKAWFPLMHKSRFSLLVGPQYRTEQLELTKSSSGNDYPIKQLSNWNLRSIGLDIKSLITVDSSSWILTNFNINQSGSLFDGSHAQAPLNYTIMGAYIKKNSPNKEFGFGILANRGFNTLTVLPVFVYHYNYSKKAGIEINLPYKIAWRYNLSPSDIIYLKAEGLTRSYYIKCIDTDSYTTFRKLDVDMGVYYNRKITKLIGVELFGGYRKNLTSKLPDGVKSIKTSGMAFSMELYIKPPRR